MEHKMKIAVYTIAKNEEQFVERWAESAKDADYRFILDTGSTDETVSKARKAGVNVASAAISPWRFDDARNAALALLPADIDMCIALDMDEILLPGWREELEKIAEPTTRPRYTYTWNWKENGEPGLQYGGDKIHKRHGYRWKHPVHEVIVTDRSTEVQEWIKLEIHHHPDNTKSRGQYLPLLELAVQEDPMDDRNAYYLAREYFFHGMLDKAKEMFETHLRLPKAQWGPERAASYRYLAKCDPKYAKEYLTRATQEAPGRREPLVELAQWHYSQENWDECLHIANSAISIAEKPLDYLCEEFAWGALPHDLAAIAAYNLGMIKLAIEFTEDALEYEPDNQRLASNLVFYKAK
jgi:tetratricopeptide (TPR) repeat protein